MLVLIEKAALPSPVSGYMVLRLKLITKIQKKTSKCVCYSKQATGGKCNNEEYRLLTCIYPRFKEYIDV